MFFLKIMLICIFFFFSKTCYSQDLYTIKGFVKDGTTYDPWGPQLFSIKRNALPGAQITIDKKDVSYTDEKGEFEISGLSAGKHKLEITYSGYYPLTYTVSKEDSLVFLLRNKSLKVGAEGALYMGQHPILKYTDIDGVEKEFLATDWLVGDILVHGDSRIRKSQKFYIRGKSYLDIDNKKAIRYLRKAANYNHPMASYELGKIFEDGSHDVNKSLGESLYYYHKAADHGSLEAKERLDIIEGRHISNIITSNLKAQTRTHGRRVALIIGNSKYNDGRYLPNVPNDCAMLAEELSKLNFKIIPRHDASKYQMRHAIDDFCEEIKDSCEAILFFYSGHGLLVEQTNYLKPTDAVLNRKTDEIDIDSACINLDYIIRKMAKSAALTKIVMIDACRENEFIGLDRGVSTSNMKAIEPPRDFFVSFATMKNEVANDGNKHYSPYMESFIEALRVPNLPLHEVFSITKAGTNIRTNKDQSPCNIDTTTGIPFYFNIKEE